MTERVEANIPLIDETLGDELFSLRGDSETTEMQRQIWHEFCLQVGPDLARALQRESQDLRKNDLHRIRGSCASCGLTGLAALLHRWEAESGDAKAAKRFGPLALDLARQSIAAMNARYPHLAPASAGRSQ